MSEQEKRAAEPRVDEFEMLDAELKQTLGDFKSSVHAWSEAEFLRPRTEHATVSHRGLKLALGWSLAGMLLAAGMTGVVYRAYERQPDRQAAITPKTVPAQATPQQKAAPEPDEARKREPIARRAASQAPEEDLLASVDSAVSRTVPSAMDPLLYMSEDNGTIK